MEYQVLKQHYGDKQYWAGDTREIKNETIAKELVKRGLIAEKEAEKPQNKAQKAPLNKARQAHKTK